MVVHVQAFTPDGETLLSGSDDCRIILWDWERRAVLSQPFPCCIAPHSISTAMACSARLLRLAAHF